MYQVQVFDRQDSSLIMESDIVSTLAEADEMVASVCQAEGYYSVIFKLDAVWSDLVPAQWVGQHILEMEYGAGIFYNRSFYETIYDVPEKSHEKQYVTEL